MNQRSKFLVSVVFAVVLLPIGAVAASAAPNVCVSVNGVEVYQSGSAVCDSDIGSRAVSVGEDSGASSADGDNNTAVAVGNDSGAIATDGDNTAVVIGEVSGAIAEDGNGNTAIAVGDDSSADTGNSGDNTLIVIGDQQGFSFLLQTGCTVVLVSGELYGSCP